MTTIAAFQPVARWRQSAHGGWFGDPEGRSRAFREPGVIAEEMGEAGYPASPPFMTSRTGCGGAEELFFRTRQNMPAMVGSSMIVAVRFPNGIFAGNPRQCFNDFA